MNYILPHAAQNRRRLLSGTGGGILMRLYLDITQIGLHIGTKPRPPDGPFHALLSVRPDSHIE